MSLHTGHAARNRPAPRARDAARPRPSIHPGKLLDRIADVFANALGGLVGLAGRPIPGHWTAPWNDRVGVSLAGVSELALDELVARTVAVADGISTRR